ncbi:MAG: hydroxyacid dehydrogenase [Pseudonocardiaceae bacterium]|nr:hydroxyacid dehydrogenase [Pseudonocardiaceae bacterium]
MVEVTRPRVVVTHWVQPEVTDRLEQFCAPVVPSLEEEVWPRRVVLARAESAVGIVSCMADCVDEAWLAACPRLRVVSAVAKGHDNIDVAACTRRGVWVTNLPDLLTAPTAELVVGLMLALLRRITEAGDYVRGGAFTGWRPVFYGTSLQGATVGIIGMGQLGQAVARRVRAFDATVIFYDPAVPPAQSATGEAAQVPLAEVLARSDVVVPLVPLTPATERMLDATALATMRRGAFLINAGRGSLVDEDAVADALQTGQLGGYAADVFAFEDWRHPDRPRAIPSRLLASSRTVLTPHLGSAVASVRRDMGLAAAEQLRQALTGTRPDNAVNEVGR